jgi:hypothetical protein
MQSILEVAVLTIAAIPIAFGQTTGNSLGTWKLNTEESKFSPSALVKNLTATREASHDGVKVTMTGERADGYPGQWQLHGEVRRQRISRCWRHTTALS